MTKDKEKINTTSDGEDKSKASIVMTGVSGKKIMADVKVVKVKKKAKPINTEEEAKNTITSTTTPVKEVVVEPKKVEEKDNSSVSTTSNKEINVKETATVSNKVVKKEENSSKNKIENSKENTPKIVVPTTNRVKETEKNQEFDKEKVKVFEDKNINEKKALSKKDSVSVDKTSQNTVETKKEESKNNPLVKEENKAIKEKTENIKSVNVKEETKVISEKTTTNMEATSLAKPSVAPSPGPSTNSSLAATVARFAAQKAAQKEAENRKNQKNAGRFGGRERDFTKGDKSNVPSKGNRSGKKFDNNTTNSFGKKDAFNKPFKNDRNQSKTGGGFSSNFLAKDKDDEPKNFNHSKKNITKKADFGSEILSSNTKDIRSSAFADKFKKNNQHKDKENQQKSFASGKEASRNIKKKALDFTRGASGEDEVLDAVFRARKGKGSKNKVQKQEQGPIVREILTNISLPAVITVKEFAEAIKKTSAEVIKNLMKYGVLATLNQEIDFDTAALLASEFGITAEQLVEVTEEDILFDDSEDIIENLVQRPPVVCVMGHVDHGKTSLLDQIRQTSVAHGEAGGITQHIGAYMVEKDGRKITFLDTPGHEAFTTMRARGAQTTDIAILVVAADDGVMPQTIESINHAKAAGTQIVVAINKIDRPGANIERVKQELAQHEILAEDWGGNITMVPVSAKTGENIEELLEMVLLTADIMDLKADPKRQAKGTIIEAKLDKQRGPVATLLVQRGTLNDGDTVVTGQIVGRIRAMHNANGSVCKHASPSVPVEVLGLPEVPEAGDIFYAVKDEKVARQLAEKRRIKNREENIGRSSKMTLENLFSKMKEGEVKDLNIIVKADVVGSVEAVRNSLERLTNEEVRVRVVHGGVGAVTESDVRLAEVTNAIIIGFNVRPATNVSELAKDAMVDMRLYRVIYNAIEDVEAAMKGMLTPTFKEVELGRLEIRQVFKASNIGTIGGSYVLSGKIVRNCEIRLVRNGIVIWEGHLASLKRFKDDVKEVAAGYECGIALENYNDIKEGDIVESFIMEEVKRT